MHILSLQGALLSQGGLTDASSFEWSTNGSPCANCRLHVCFTSRRRHPGPNEQQRHNHCPRQEESACPEREELTVMKYHAVPCRCRTQHQPRTRQVSEPGPYLKNHHASHASCSLGWGHRPPFFAHPQHLWHTHPPIAASRLNIRRPGAVLCLPIGARSLSAPITQPVEPKPTG